MKGLKGIHTGKHISTIAARNAAYRDMKEYYEAMDRKLVYEWQTLATRHSELQEVRKDMIETASEIAKEYIKNY